MSEVASNSISKSAEPPVTGSTDSFDQECQLSVKVKEKLSRLAEWRIDSSKVQLTEDVSFKGGFATVCKGLLVSDPPVEKLDGDTKAHETVAAVKKMTIQSTSDRNRVLGLALREAEFLVDLSGAFVITILGFVENISEDQIWLLFPWADHGNLRAFIASANWEVPERISLIWDVVQAVEYLHGRDPPICHGDLKSVNIVVNAEFRAVITDFGSARRVVANDGRRSRASSIGRPEDLGDDSDLALETTISAATNTITITGNQFTLRWAAPELLTDDYGDEKSDIWAMGWVLYETMTGAIPFESIKKDIAVTRHILQGKLPTITEHARIALTLALGSLMTACWRTNPQERPTAQSCRKSISWLPMSRPDLQRDPGPSAANAHLLVKIGRMYLDQNDYTNAMVTFTKALDMYTELAKSRHDASPISAHEEQGRGTALLEVAEVHLAQSQFEAAIRLYSEAAGIFRDLGNIRDRAQALAGMGEAYRLLEETSEAVSFYAEAAQLFEEIGDKGGKCSTLAGRAAIHQAARENTDAIALFSEAAQLAEEIGDESRRAFALEGLAAVYWGQRDYNMAVSLYSEAAQFYGAVGSKELKNRCLGLLAQIQANVYGNNSTISPTHAQQDVENSPGSSNTNEAQSVIRLPEDLLQDLQLSGALDDKDSSS